MTSSCVRGPTLTVLIVICILLPLITSTSNRRSPVPTTKQFFPNGRYGRRDSMPSLQESIGGREMTVAFFGDGSVHCVYTGYQDYYKCERTSFRDYQLIREDGKMNNYMTEIHKLGIEITSITQLSFQDFGGFFIWISKAFDPRHCYLICFPLLFPFNRSAGIQVLWTAAVTEWLNHVYKWFLFGERPYWWVHTNSHLWEPNKVPVIQQFSNTCETGPGSPSGHVMISSAVLYVFVKGFLEAFSNRSSRLSSPVYVMAWVVYALTVVSISISRIYIAAHFPHQCLVGLICGVILGFILSNAISVSRLNFKGHCLMALGTFSVAMTTYYIIIGLGIDPNWTLPLAKRWCSHAEWVHLNTTPFYMLWRYTSTLLGIGLALLANNFLRSNVFQNSGLFTKCFLAAVGIFVTMTTEGFISTGSSPFLVYSSEFVVHSLIPVLVISVVPWVSQVVF